MPIPGGVSATSTRGTMAGMGIFSTKNEDGTKTLNRAPFQGNNKSGPGSASTLSSRA